MCKAASFDSVGDAAHIVVTIVRSSHPTHAYQPTRPQDVPVAFRIELTFARYRPGIVDLQGITGE
ncbi:MAG: hypothetical protein E6I93_09200 [Chloroflexi bacterium]|nr:MAG: hypothetical protein E6I93_09200 [Chloroflexota bacterium]